MATVLMSAPFLYGCEDVILTAVVAVVVVVDSILWVAFLLLAISAQEAIKFYQAARQSTYIYQLAIY